MAPVDTPVTELRNVLSIATLLGDCEILQKSEVSSIMATAAHENLTVGQYLHKNQIVHAQVIRGAIICHLLLRRKLLKYSMALEAIKLTLQHKCKIELALSSLRWNRPYFESIFQISELVRKAGLLKESELDLAYEICFRDESPLLFVLVQRGTLSDLDADRVFSLQGKLASGACTLDQAARELRRDHDGETGDAKVDAATRSDDPGNSHNAGIRQLRLGEILLAADLVTSLQLISAVELGRVEKMRFGEILVRDTDLTEAVLNQAAFVQTQINSNFVTVYEGVQNLMAFVQEQKGAHGRS